MTGKTGGTALACAESVGLSGSPRPDDRDDASAAAAQCPSSPAEAPDVDREAAAAAAAALGAASAPSGASSARREEESAPPPFSAPCLANRFSRR